MALLDIKKDNAHLEDMVISWTPNVVESWFKKAELESELAMADPDLILSRIGRSISKMKKKS